MAYEGLMSQIANPQMADIAGALDFRQQRILEEQKRQKDAKMKELIAQAIPGLRPGSVLSEMAAEDPERYMMFSKAMGIPMNEGDKIEQMAQDVRQISKIASRDPEGAMAFVNSLASEREQLGLDVTKLRQWQELAKTDFGKAQRAMSMLDETLNSDLINAERMQEREMKLKERGLDIQDKRLNSGAEDPSGLREFQGMTEGLSTEEKENARRIALGLAPRAVGSAAITTATQGLTDTVAGSESTIKDATKRAEQEAVNATETGKEYFGQLQNIQGNINNYKEGIRLLREDGASTGVIEKRLPSLKAASQKLDNLRNRLGLDVVSGTTFGALSEAELAMALDTGMPSSLKPAELANWFEERMVAQQKLANVLDGAVQFIAIPGNSLADLRAEQKKSAPAEAKSSGETAAQRLARLRGGN